MAFRNKLTRANLRSFNSRVPAPAIGLCQMLLAHVAMLAAQIGLLDKELRDRARRDGTSPRALRTWRSGASRLPLSIDGADARARAIAWMFAALNTVEPPMLDLSTAKVVEGDMPRNACRWTWSGSASG